MRTGGGKTMIFAIPALLEDQKTAVVFCPLKSLIIDQMNELKKLGIASGLLILQLPVCL
jgi:superfamily II DNA helicase RecQ